MGSIETDCGQCNGTGKKKYGGVLQDCRYCGGSGRVVTTDQRKPSK